MEARELKANVRKESGKEQARRMRREGLIPAVLYGPGTDPVSLSVNASDLKTALKGAEENVLIKLIIDDSGRLTEKNSLIRELQINHRQTIFSIRIFTHSAWIKSLRLMCPSILKDNRWGSKKAANCSISRGKSRFPASPRNCPIASPLTFRGSTWVMPFSSGISACLRASAVLIQKTLYW